VESASRTLSRWRHGFKSRWDYLTLRCANQRRDLVRGQDLPPAPHAKLLYQKPDERLPLLGRGALDEQPEVSSPISHVVGRGSRRELVRVSFGDRSLLGLQSVDPFAQTLDAFLAVRGRHGPLFEGTEVSIQALPGTS
jgi:hypothetical protein